MNVTDILEMLTPYQSLDGKKAKEEFISKIIEKTDTNDIPEILDLLRELSADSSGQSTEIPGAYSLRSSLMAEKNLRESQSRGNELE